MVLQEKTLEKLRNMINEETEYRTGPQLVKFFNQLGFNDQYGQGFPSRWQYTDQKLALINGTPEIDKSIKILFNPVNFIGRYEVLDQMIKDFNQYLAYDNWKVIRQEQVISFVKADKIDFTSEVKNIDVNDFLNKEFQNIPLEQLGLEAMLIEIIKARFEEIKNCINAKASLSVIFLVGSSLEGILLGFATKYPRAFNQASAAPKQDDGKVKQFHMWTLNNFIEVSYELGLLMEDVKKFSHSVRDFRNYIHPFQQLSTRFSPDENTAMICWQVLKAAIFQLHKNNTKLQNP